MKLPSFITVCSKVFRDCASLQLLGVGVGNLVINTIILSTCYKYANDAFVAKDLENGLTFIYMWLFITAINELYRKYVSEPTTQQFSTEVDICCEISMNNILVELDYEANRDINSDKNIENKMYCARWKMSSMVSSYVSTVMSLGTLIGHVFWMFMIAPRSLIGYAIAIVIVQCITVTVTMTRDEKRKKYDKYWFYKTIFINENVHGNGDKVMDKINDAGREIGEMRHKTMVNHDVLRTQIGILFCIVMAFNCYYFGATMTVAELITFIQYSSSLKHTTVQCFNTYKHYVESNCDYCEYTELMLQYREKEEIIQIKPTTSIVIEELYYEYPKSNKKEPFYLKIDKKMEICSGDIVLINGDSGNGKSTFFDILGGYKHDDTYKCDVSVDDIRINGFECLRDSRIYTEQKDYIFTNMSITELVTNKVYVGDVDMTIVFKALSMCCCDDFVSIDNVHDDKPKFSGGQEGRIKIARTVYRILTTNPRIVLLDEIDKAVQPLTVVKIMDNIFKHCKEQGIFTFVIAHTTEMHVSEKYDKVFTFVKGVIV